MILCLLVSCKIFSQKDINDKNKYVFLTEKQAKQTIEDLLLYDALKLISAKQEKRINDLHLTISVLESNLSLKDSIISNKDSIITTQENIISFKKSIEFHTYGGVEFLDFSFIDPSFYVRASMETNKILLGVKIVARPTKQYNIPQFYTSVNAEFKFF